MTEQLALSLTEAVDAVAGTAATNEPAPQPESTVPPAMPGAAEPSTPEGESEAKTEGEQPTLAEEPSEEPRQKPEDEYVTLDEGPINYEDAAALVVKDKDGNDVNVSDLLGERYMQAQYTQDMGELTELRKEMETVGKTTNDFQNVMFNEVAGLVQHYNQYWRQLPAEAQQILRQLAQLHDSGREQQQQWRTDYERQVQAARINEVRYGTKRLRGYIPDWNRGVYSALKEHYQSNYGTNPTLIDDIVDPGLMAGLYQGMQQAHARKKLRRQAKPKGEPTSVAPTQGDQQPSRGKKSAPKTFGSIEDAVDFMTQE